MDLFRKRIALLHQRVKTQKPPSEHTKKGSARPSADPLTQSDDDDDSPEPAPNTPTEKRDEETASETEELSVDENSDLENVLPDELSPDVEEK